MSDPSVIINTKRIIGWKDGSQASLKPNQYTVMYEVFIIVRRNQDFFNQLHSDIGSNGDPVSEYLNRVYSVANDRVNLWLNLATRTWRGYEGFDMSDDERVELCKHPTIPASSGPATVTVWGSIVDQQGRMMTLTVTDQTIGIDALAEIPYAIGLYDAVTQISHDEDLNPYGNPVVRKTTVMSTEVSGRKAPSKSKPTVPGTPPVKSKSNIPFPKTSPKEPPIHCAKMSDLRNIEKGAFTLDVGRATLTTSKKGSKTLNFYGYTEGATGITLDTNGSVYVYEDRPEFEGCLQMLKNAGYPATDEGSIHNFNKPILISGQKLISAQGTAFYADVEIKSI